MKRLALITFLSVLFISPQAVADWFGPDNYKFPETNNKTDPNVGRERFGKKLRIDLDDDKGHKAIRQIEFVDFPSVIQNTNPYSEGSKPRFMN